MNGGIIYIEKNGLRWKDALLVFSLPRTLDKRFVRRSRRGVFARLKDWRRIASRYDRRGEFLSAGWIAATVMSRLRVLTFGPTRLPDPSPML